MKKITIEEVHNGYVVEVEGSNKYDGPWCYKATEIFEMLERVGLITYDARVEVKVK